MYWNNQQIDELNQIKPKIATKLFLWLISSAKELLIKTKDLAKGAMKPKIKKQKQSKKDRGMEAKKTPGAEEKITSEKALKFKKWKRFNIVEYRLVILIIVAAILFGGSLMVVSNKKDKQQKSEGFQNTVTTIEDKINSVEAALIYKDEERAQELLNEARALLNSLTSENPEQQYAYQQLKERVEGQVNKIYKLEPIKNPALLANLPENFKATSNIYLGRNNIIYLAGGGEIYKINSENKALDKVADIGEQVVKFMDFEKNKALILTANNSLWLLDTSNYSTRKVGFKLPGAKSKLVDVSSYAKKLYLLDEGMNNIYKYSYKTTNFSGASAWLSNSEDISGNRVIDVDGSIWLAAKDGQISKFFKGKKEVFSLKGAYDQISENTDLFTRENLNNLYLLDRDKNRILIADKTGKVNKQMLGDKLESILSVTPNANENEIYIMTGKKVYKVKL